MLDDILRNYRFHTVRAVMVDSPFRFYSLQGEAGKDEHTRTGQLIGR